MEYTHAEATKAIQYALNASVDKGPVLMLAGEYPVENLTIEGVLCGGAPQTVIKGQVTFGSGSVSDISFDEQNWSLSGARIVGSSFKSLTLDQSNNARIDDCRIEKLIIRDSSDLFVRHCSIDLLEIDNVKRSVVTDNIVEHLIERHSDNLLSNNIVAGRVINANALRPLSDGARFVDPVVVKTGVVTVTGISGGMRLPDIYCERGATLFVANVRFAGQEHDDPRFFIGDAPYYDARTHPQSMGFELKTNENKTLNITNLSQLSAVSTISGAYLSYIVLD